MQNLGPSAFVSLSLSPLYLIWLCCCMSFSVTCVSVECGGHAHTHTRTHTHTDSCHSRGCCCVAFKALIFGVFPLLLPCRLPSLLISTCPILALPSLLLTSPPFRPPAISCSSRLCSGICLMGNNSGWLL